MKHVTTHAIDLIEAAYHLEKSDAAWLPDLIDAGAPILDHGLGVFGFELVRAPLSGGGADVVIEGMHLRSLPEDLPDKLNAAVSRLSPEFIAAATRAGYAGTWTEKAKDYPEELGPLLEAIGYSDMLGILAFDPNGVGVEIGAPLPESTTLTPKSRERWQMLGAHIASAYRLRRALAEMEEHSHVEPTGLPCDAEAVFDVHDFQIVDSVARAQEPNVADFLREAALAVDRARGKLRKNDPQQALELWKALVCGRWSLVDWFDTDQRRFVLAMPNPPEVSDPRGLSEQERQVVAYVLLGDPSKLVAYRLGLSPARVSGLLKSAMHKLSVTTKAGLAEKLRPMGIPAVTLDDESAA